MSKILLITPLYPIPFPENNATDVCHSFTKEWVKLGHNVQVIHMQPVHCQLWYLVIRLFGKKISNKVGGGNFYKKRIWRTQFYKMDDVPVFRVPIYNFIPHGLYSKRSISRFLAKVYSVLDTVGFSPDIIAGHMMPIEITSEIKFRYKCKLSEVFHGVDKKAGVRYENYQRLVNNLDYIGFRCSGIKSYFEEFYWEVNNPFICSSGIPQYFTEGRVPRNFLSINRFIFAGELIERKHPDVVLNAVSKSYSGCPFSLEFIGDGPELSKLVSLAEELGVSSNVIFRGKISREEMKNAYDNADCMIMVSHGEAFGLVYLEAMSRGCITVGSKGEGIDGIIVDGKNGFLSKAGNTEELVNLLDQLKQMNAEKLHEISFNAAITSEYYTDKQAAENYLKNIGL